MKRIALLLLLLAAPAFAATVTDSQVSCTSGGGVTIGTAAGRTSLTVTNPSQTVTVYVGATGANTEYSLLPGNSFTWDQGNSASFVYKCLAGSTVAVGVHQVFNGK